MKLALYTVGPLTNKYSGVHTYSDVLIPFVNELTKQNVDVTWLGVTLENTSKNTALHEMGIHYCNEYALSMEKALASYPKSWDFVDPTEFDALLCQPRPITNVLENKILLATIQRFLDADKPVFCWEVDMFTDDFTTEMREKVVLLHPAIKPTTRFKHEIYFPFFTYSRIDNETPERLMDFVFLGNIYFRQPQAIQFFAPLNNTTFEKIVFGSWLQDTERRKFSSQFTNFNFKGSTEHWAAIPVLRRAKATLHIVPDFARDRGLMTARVFTSQMANCLCFCDSAIYGAEQFFPKELIVKDGAEIVERWESVQANRERLLAERAELLKEHTVENRVKQFLEIFENEIKK